MPHIKTDKLYFSNNNIEILKDISFSAKGGEVLAVLGKNGAGKTTLFKCILGFLEPDSGEIFINEGLLKGITQTERAKKMAYIPQSHYPVFDYKVIDVVLMGRSAHVNYFSIPGNKDYEVAVSFLDELGILHLANRGYGRISGGERQLVLIARALTQKSEIIIMDEPTANLDYGNQIKVMEYIKKLSKKGYCILLSTHNPEHVLLYSDKVLAIHEGRVLVEGDTNKILNESILEAIYDIPVRLEEIWYDNIKYKYCIPRINNTGKL